MARRSSLLWRLVCKGSIQCPYVNLKEAIPGTNNVHGYIWALLLLWHHLTCLQAHLNHHLRKRSRD